MSPKSFSAFLATGLALSFVGSSSGAVAKGYTTSNFALSIEGGSPAFIKSVSGGEPRAEVVSESAGSASTENKHLGAVSYTPMVIQAPVTESQGLIERAFSTDGKSFSGEVSSLDHNYKVVVKRSFQDAIVTEFSLSQLDATDGKTPAMVMVKLQPVFTKRQQGGGESLPGTIGTKQKASLSSNFRLSLGGLPTARVSKIEPITIKRSLAVSSSGEARRREVEEGRMVHGDLVIEVSALDAAAYQEYLESFVVKGNNGDDKELSGRVELLDPTLQKVLFAMEAKGVGIYHIEELAAAEDKVATIRCRFYVEQWVPVFDGKSSAEAAPAPTKTPSNTASTPPASATAKPTTRQPGTFTPANPDLKKPIQR